jgi:hypothetical protein
MFRFSFRGVYVYVWERDVLERPEAASILCSCDEFLGVELIGDAGKQICVRRMCWEGRLPASNIFSAAGLRARASPLAYTPIRVKRSAK